MNAVELFKRSIGKWEGRRWYVYDNGDKIVRYTQFSNEVISTEQFLFPEGISVTHSFKVWNVTEGKLENEMTTVLHSSFRPHGDSRYIGTPISDERK
ncbi:hypothetical protein [Aphanothece sacrum]|uniref:Uncharacterized protein n=1 Tax=Aphanothece sacrum FPU1 TaxID=1920663 RepID=A0A401ICU8_APHSA|nr:hypothetical protein [Aphanothece sacrum]GBF78990.1 hypothetical protein AsFPU1_0382 [Aphanothece sacrum FPU1]GBF86662.1 hypothetical protein AsFPU3_3734 [Aphanothece sacrum FPU3]